MFLFFPHKTYTCKDRIRCLQRLQITWASMIVCRFDVVAAYNSRPIQFSIKSWVKKAGL